MVLASITDWWTQLSSNEQIFWGIALISTALFTFQFIMSMIGVDADSDMDVHGDWEVADGADLHLFSLRAILAGLMMFGWTGVGVLGSGQNILIASAWSVFTGLLALVGVAYFMRFFLRLQDKGQNFDLHNALHEIGEVYLRIPPQQSGKGKIHITFSNMYQELDAITTSETEIPTGCKVRVVEITPENILRVEAL